MLLGNLHFHIHPIIVTPILATGGFILVRPAVEIFVNSGKKYLERTDEPFFSYRHKGERTVNG